MTAYENILSKNFWMPFTAIKNKLLLIAQSFMLILFCLVSLSNFRGNNPMQIAMPYRSGPKCADCPGHCDKGLCSKSLHTP